MSAYVSRHNDTDKLCSSREGIHVSRCNDQGQREGMHDSRYNDQGQREGMHDSRYNDQVKEGARTRGKDPRTRGKDQGQGPGARTRDKEMVCMYFCRE
eukprot:gene10983-biopygen466